MTDPQAPPGTPASGARVAWHAIGGADVATRLGSDARLGLAEPEAERRLETAGPNVLVEAPGTPWQTVLFRQFANALILVLVVAAAISALAGKAADAVTIVAIVLLNGVLGFVQEWRAERAVRALRRMLSPQATVSRGGRLMRIPSERIVPGDLVRLDVGARVPADLRLTEATDLRVDEASLTGESVPVRKGTDGVDERTMLAERASMAWTGTTVVHGRGAGIAVATGMETEFGRIAHLAQSVVREPTPLQRKLAVLARQLGFASIVVAAVVAALGISLGRGALDVFLTGVSLAVAVVPEGLPAVVTITLALGIRTMSRRRALLRRLPAAETLGAATVICTDKTGTLTANEMTVCDIWLDSGAITVTGSGYDPAGGFEEAGRPVRAEDRPDLLEALETGVSCNHARVADDGKGWQAVGEATEAALVVAALKAGITTDSTRGSAREIAELPFTSDRKRMTVVTVAGEVSGRADGGEAPAARTCTAHVKGAPEILLDRCTRVRTRDGVRPLDAEARRRVEDAGRRMAEDGRRTLALARRDLSDTSGLDAEEVESDLTLLGVVGMLDPPRPEVPAAVERARSAGIAVIMITGDAPGTAVAVARAIGMRAREPILGDALSSMTDADLGAALSGDAVFARTTPEHKLRIVEQLQAMGHIVGMTGDGVNDAPALQRADVGIAMGIRGTDAARGAADMIITDDNFASIVGAVEEGRRQQDNIQKFVRYLLSSNAGEVIAILGNLLLRAPLILLPVQILWMNLVTDSVTALALGLEPAEDGVMRRRPRPPGGRILDRQGIWMVAALGAYIGVATLWLFDLYGDAGPRGALVAQTVAVTAIVLLEKVNVFNFRALHEPIARIGFFSNPRLIMAWVAMVGLQACAVYVPFLQRSLHTVPLAARDWLVMTAVAAPVFIVPETITWLAARRR